MAASYKELVVWQKSVELVIEVYEITKRLPRSEVYGLSSQIRRAAVSIPSNISEGYMRKSRKEYIQFCAVASGSAAELETQLIITARLYSDIDCSFALERLTEVQKMLYALIERLKVA